MVESKRKKTDAVLDPIVIVLERLGLRPNQVTTASLIICLIGVYIFWFYSHAWGLLVFMLSVLLDSLDGALARKTKMTTKYGNYLDALIDKFVEVMIFFSFGVYNWPLAFAAGASSILVSYSRHRADQFKVKASGGLFQRPQRIGFVLVSAFALELVSLQEWIPVIMATTAVLSLATIIQRMHQVKKALG